MRARVCVRGMCLNKTERLSGVVVERPPRVQEAAGSIPGPVIPTTLQMVVMAALLDAQDCELSITTD